MAKARAHLLISGRVQGVFYRAFTEDAARKCGLRGWVRNTEGGDVEAVLEGERKDIERAIGILREGPPAARVSNIDVRWQPHAGEFDTFSVRYF
jgi:acylphosphatase